MSTGKSYPLVCLSARNLSAYKFSCKITKNRADGKTSARFLCLTKPCRHGCTPVFQTAVRLAAARHLKRIAARSPGFSVRATNSPAPRSSPFTFTEVTPCGVFSLMSGCHPPVTVTSVGLPPLHFMSTEAPPRTLKPCRLPSVHYEGRAGSRLMKPSWLCTSISAMPDVPPQLPSIWKGGCEQNRLGNVPLPCCFGSACV